MKTLIRELRGEHAVILSKLEDFAHRLDGGEPPDLAKFLEFFDEYVERRHHAKEEGQLFARMREDPFLKTIVDGLLEEHENERRMVEHLRSGGDAAQILAIYLENLRWHIIKENTIVFKSAEAAFA